MKSSANKLFFFGALAFLFLTFEGLNMATPRGIRNNNPGNIRGAGYQWQGETGRDDKGFVIFSSPLYGLRAMARTLKTYREKHFLVTIRQVIERWAPDSENNTSAYVDSVAARSGIGADTYIEPDDYPALIAAMIYHENGQQPYSLELINEGISLA